MQYIMLMNFVEDSDWLKPEERTKLEDFLNMVIQNKPLRGCIANVLSAIVYFIFAVLLDMKKQAAFRF